MIATLRETWTSIKNLEYGREIIKKTVGEVFWYWLKYFLLLVGIIAVLAISALVYFTPQIPRLIERRVPQMTIEITNGKLTTNIPQPLEYKDENFTFILDTSGRVEDIDQIESGVLVLEDRLLFKDQGQTRMMQFSELDQDLKLDKQVVVDWLEKNKATLLSGGIGILLVVGLIFAAIYLVWKWVMFALGGLTLFILSRLNKKPVNFADALKLAIFAAVPALLGSLLLGLFSAGETSSIIGLAIWAFFAIAWLTKLPYTKK